MQIFKRLVSVYEEVAKFWTAFIKRPLLSPRLVNWLGVDLGETSSSLTEYQLYTNGNAYGQNLLRHVTLFSFYVNRYKTSGSK